MRRLSLAVLACLTLLLSGCSTGGSAEDPSSGGKSGKVEITYGYWDELNNEPLKQIVSKFEASHPNIRVKLQETAPDQYWTKLKTAVTGGSAPDVISMNGVNYQLYAANGVLLPLDDYIKNDKIDLSHFPKSMVKLYDFGSHHYAMPQNFATVALWYNKAIFDAAGVKYPDANWTWKDVQSAATKVTDKSKGVYGLAADGQTQEGYYNTVAQAGGYVISPDGKKSGLDDPKTIEGLRFWTDLQKAGASPTYQQLLDTDAVSMFQSGKLAMFYGGPWRALQFKQAKLTNVDVAPLPKGPSDKLTTVHGTAFTIWSKTKHPKEAWEFVKYLGSKEGQLQFGQTGLLIPAYEGTQTEWLKSMPQYHLQVYIDEADNAIPYPVSRNTDAWMTDVSKALTPAWNGQEDIAVAAKKAAARMNADLAKEKK